MAETNGKLTEFRDLPEDFLGNKVNAPMLRSEINLGLEPAGADLDTAVRGGHGCTQLNDAKGGRERKRERTRERKKKKPKRFS